MKVPEDLDADLAERMLRGDPTGPPALAGLLAAASSGPAPGDLEGEEAAVAAFRAARAPHVWRPRARRLSALGLKAALTGLSLVLAGGAAVAGASQHLPGPIGTRHAHDARTPTTSWTSLRRVPPRAPERPVPGRHAEPPKHPWHPGMKAWPKGHHHRGGEPHGGPGHGPHPPSWPGHGGPGHGRR